MSIWYKLSEIKDELSWKAGKALDTVKDGVSTVSESVSDVVFDIKYDRSNVFTNMHQRGSAVTSEKIMNVVFPATGARLSAERLRGLDATLSSKVTQLNKLLEEKDQLERNVALEFERGGMVRQSIRASLNEFAHQFSKLDNEAQYKMRSIETKLNLEMPVEAGGTIEFSKLDSALLKIYEDDFNMLSIFKQSPVTAAIISLREKSLTDEINKCLNEVTRCITNVELMNQDMKRLLKLTTALNNELGKTNVLLNYETEKLVALIQSHGTDTMYYGEKEAVVIDNGLMMFALTVRLLNTPVYSKEQGDFLNSNFAQQIIKDSEENLIDCYGAEMVANASDEYKKMTSLTFKEGVSLISVQKLEDCRSIRRHLDDLLVGYVSHYNRGSATSYSLLSERQSYDRDFADFGLYDLLEEVEQDRSRFNSNHYRGYINQVSSKHDIFSDFSGRFMVLSKDKTFGYDKFVFYDVANKRGVFFDINMQEFNMFNPSFNLISACILPTSANSAEVVLTGHMTSYQSNIGYLCYKYENGRLSKGEGKLKEALDFVNAQSPEKEKVVNILTADKLENFIFETVEHPFVDSPYHTQRQNFINLYKVVNGQSHLLKSPRKVMMDKTDIDSYLHHFAFDYNDPRHSNNDGNYLHMYLGFGLRNKVTIAENRFFVLDYYSPNGSYELGLGEWENQDFVRCNQRILEFDLEKDELLATHEIGIANPNVHEILYHNGRLYVIDLTNGLLIYTI